MSVEVPLHRADETLDCLGDAVLSIDLRGIVAYLNPAAEAMTGWSRQMAVGQPVGDVLRIIDRDTRTAARDPMALALELNKTVGLTPNCLLMGRDGHELPIEDSAAPIRDRHGALVGAVIVFRGVGAALETARQMVHLAQHDTLTGLPNRLLFEDRLGEALGRSRRHGRPVAILFMDVDRFKAINDSLGHAAGDHVLRAIGGRLKDALRQTDTVCRYGGDEFVAVLSELEREEDATLVARKAIRVIAEPIRVGSTQIAVTASIGISVCPHHGCEAALLTGNADAAMFRAKRTGGSEVRTFDRTVDVEIPARAS